MRRNPYKEVNLAQAKQDFDELEAMGFQVKQFSEYHCRIFKEGSSISVDIWPSTKVFMQRGAHSTGQYKDLVDIIEEIYS